MKNKATYHATVQNEQGARMNAGSDTNLNALKAQVRAGYGRGWTVRIVKVENDNGIMDFAPELVAEFTLR